MAPRNRQRPGGASMLSPQPEALVREPSAAPATEPAKSSPAPAKAEQTTPEAATPETDESVYLSARVPRGLRDELQHQAIRERRPVAQLVQDAVRLYLDQNTSIE